MSKRRQGNKDLVICCGCQGFFSNRRIYQHKKKCGDKGLCGFKDVDVPQNVSLAGVVSEEFLELFALTEVPEEKNAFYKQLVHSQQINRHVYKSPLAGKEVNQVGKFLDTLDQETYETPGTHTDETKSTEGSYDSTELPTADVPQGNEF